MTRIKPRPWTPEDDAELRRAYLANSASEVGRLMGRSRVAIRNRVHKLGIRKGTNPSQFTKGFTPWNKGARFICGGRNPDTQFQPGHRPHTWNPIGHERVIKDGYLQRKLTDTGITRRDYVLIHHIVWREAGREIPPGHALVFRDGDKRNCALDNLELVSRATLMQRNSVHNYGPEIAALTQLRGAINRQINARSKPHE